jgi:perosamine synthetase
MWNKNFSRREFNRLYDQVTRASFHFFPFRYIKEEFSNLGRDQFQRALNAEGIR